MATYRVPHTTGRCTIVYFGQNNQLHVLTGWMLYIAHIHVHNNTQDGPRARRTSCNGVYPNLRKQYYIITCSKMSLLFSANWAASDDVSLVRRKFYNKSVNVIWIAVISWDCLTNNLILVLSFLMKFVSNTVQ